MKRSIRIPLYLKLFGILVVSFMIPLVTLSAIFIRSYTGLTEERAVDSVMDDHQQLSSTLNSYMEQIEGAGNMLFVNTELISIIRRSQERTMTDEESIRGISTIIRQLTPYFKAPKPEIAVVDRSGKLLGGDYLSHYFSAPELFSYLDRYLESDVVPLSTRWETDCALFGTGEEPHSI